MIEKKISTAINGTTNDYTSSVFDYGLLCMATRWNHQGRARPRLLSAFQPRLEPRPRPAVPYTLPWAAPAPLGAPYPPETLMPPFKFWPHRQQTKLLTT